MTWTAYHVVLRLMSPLHVGHLAVGNLKRTRHYVPGKTLWGALTARLTRDFPDLGGSYEKIGQRVNEELAFSYFYPALKPEMDQALYPDYTPNGLRYGSEQIATDKFTWSLISSFASTAVDARRTAAEEASLHEVEFISPRDRETGCPVYLVGYVFEQEGCKLPWQDVLNRLQLGGERKYGWGRVCTDVVEALDGNSVELLSRYRVQLEGDRARSKRQTVPRPALTLSAALAILKVGISNFKKGMVSCRKSKSRTSFKSRSRSKSVKG